LTTRACHGGFIAVYGVDGRPLLAVVYVEANVTGSKILSVVRECEGLVGECYPGTKLALAVPLTGEAAPARVAVQQLSIKPVTVTATTTGKPAATRAAAKAETATTITTVTAAVTVTVTRTVYTTAATAAATTAAAPPPTAAAGVLGHLNTSTSTPETGGWSAGERLAFTLTAAVAAAATVYLAWRMRG